MTTTPDFPNFRAHCAELLFAIQLYTGQNPAASEMSSVEVTEKLMNAMAATTVALAAPPPKPGKPTAWMYQGEDDFDGIRWRENWEVTIDEKLARFKSGNKEPIPLLEVMKLYDKGYSQTTPPEPPTDEGIATAFQKGADQEFCAIVEVLTEYCGAGVELTDSDVSEVLYELRRKQNTKTKPEPPTDEELRKLWLDLYATNDGPTSGEVVVIARAVLERWGGTLNPSGHGDE